MTLQDIIEFLDDEASQYRLERRDIERCALLIHDIGMAAERSRLDLPAKAPGDHANDFTNTWLAEMGYATWRMVLKQEGRAVGYIGETLEQAAPEVQHAWRAAAAAIRRRVVNWRLPAEEEPPHE